MMAFFVVLPMLIVPAFALPLFVDETDVCKYFYDFESYEDCVYSDDSDWVNWEEYDYPNIVFLNYTIPENASVASWDVSLTFGEAEVEIFNITDNLTSSCPFGDGSGTLMLHWNLTGSCYADGAWHIIFDNASTFIEGGILFDMAEEPEEELEVSSIQTILSDVGSGLGAMLSVIAMPLGNFVLFLGTIAGVVAIVYAVAYALKSVLKR